MKKLYSLFTLLLLIGLLNACQNKETIVPTPTNLAYEAYVVSWDKIAEASYEVVINQKVYEIEDNTFDVSFLETGSHQIKLRAVIEQKRSLYSELMINIERPKPTNLIINNNTLSFNTSDYSIGTELYIDGTLIQTIETSDFDLLGIGLEINKTYQVNLISLYLNDFKSNLSDTINYYYYESGHPYLISPASINYQDESLVFKFHLGEATFVNIIAGHNDNMDTNDYNMTDDTLTIKESFVSRLLDDNPDRQTIILTYQLKFGTKFIIGYLFIHLT